MSCRITRDLSFQAGTYYDEQFLMNIYDISICIQVDTESFREQNVAMERIEYFIAECLSNSIFIKQSETKMIEKYTQCGFKLCTLPENPYDQTISVVLLLKLNAICEGKVTITDITLGSAQGNGVSYLFDDNSPVGPFATEGWWTDSTTCISDISKYYNKKDKIVQLFNTTAASWSDVGLTWKEKTEEARKANITFITDNFK
jgi:hypothetical protein